MSGTTILTQALSVSISLIASGAIATFSLFDLPILKSQPANRSLPSIRWLFSRGSHIFPPAATISSAGFLYLAFASRRPGQTIIHLLNLATNGVKVNGYLAAGVLCYSIAPFTMLVMVPTNFKIIKMNEDKGGARSEANANSNGGDQTVVGRSAEDSVNGEGQTNQFTDLSGPAEKTEKKATHEEEKMAEELLDKFGKLNLVRAVLIGAGGIIGLVVSLI